MDRNIFLEIFLFFDCDKHQNNLSSRNIEKDVLDKMPMNFDNETENGKFYINYPMVEVLRDFSSNICGGNASLSCFILDFS